MKVDLKRDFFLVLPNFPAMKTLCYGIVKGNRKVVSTCNPTVAVAINLMLYGNRINEVKRGVVICIQPI